tara:strand:- start:120 stop:1163 length:1044 start_codon:yes stop_codon:yes gene_type:complete
MKKIEKVKFSCDLSFLKNKSLLITGGTGSFGQTLTETLLESGQLKKLIIFSRDEYKQSLMQQRLKQHNNFNTLRFFIGDVRNVDRLMMAFRTVDYVVHAAALKQIDTAEYNPFECIRTNIIGSENVVRASLQCSVKKVIALSTDKAVNPVNLYGASKLSADKIFIAANSYAGEQNTTFSVVRYGNVLDSRGSVISLFKELLSKNKDIPVTDMRMTRFWIKKKEGINFVLRCLQSMQGSEIFIPKLPSMSIADLIKNIKKKVKIKKINIRPGEKLHETLLTKEDARDSYEGKDYFVVLPTWRAKKIDFKKEKLKKVSENFEYVSNNNNKKVKHHIIYNLFNYSKKEID